MCLENDGSVKQQETVVDKEGTSSALEKDALKKEAEMIEADRQTEKDKVNSGTDSKLVPMDEEKIDEKEPELGEGHVKMKDEVRDGRTGQEASIAREGDKEEKRKRVDLKDEEKDVQERGVQSKVDAEPGEKQKKVERSAKNCEKGEGGKKEKKEKSEKKEEVEKTEGKKEEKEKKKEKKKEEMKEEEEEKKGKKEKKTETEKKKEKKEKKSKNSSERIQKKLDKINAKIGRILAKKEEYELRLEEAQQRERQEAEKAEGKEASAAVAGKSTNDNNGSGLRTEESKVTDQLRLIQDASAKQSNKKLAEEGVSSPLSRTASLIEATPAELMEGVVSQRKVVEKLANLEVSDGSAVNPPLATEDSDVVTIGQGEVLKHTLQVDDSKDIGTS